MPPPRRLQAVRVAPPPPRAPAACPAIQLPPCRTVDDDEDGCRGWRWAPRSPSGCSCPPRSRWPDRRHSGPCGCAWQRPSTRTARARSRPSRATRAASPSRRRPRTSSRPTQTARWPTSSSTTRPAARSSSCPPARTARRPTGAPSSRPSTPTATASRSPPTPRTSSPAIATTPPTCSSSSPAPAWSAPACPTRATRRMARRMSRTSPRTGGMSHSPQMPATSSTVTQTARPTCSSAICSQVSPCS